jgi:hypothetical protein
MTPTARCLTDLRKLGATCAVVERWNQWAKKRIDLFNFADLLAIVGRSIVALQVTTGANHSARKAKILAEPKALAWVKAGGLIELWSYSKMGARGKRKVWTVRKEEIIETDFGR